MRADALFPYRIDFENEATATAAAQQVAVEELTLPNGMQFLLVPRSDQPNVVSAGWVAKVGSVNERPGITGISHFFEHMMFQGSKHVPGDSHFQLLEAAGASGVNGTTSFDRTNYFETLPASELELGLWLESDRMGYLLDTVDEAKLANQQDVVRNERRQSYENRPYGLAAERLVQTLFPKGHPYYGNVIGSHADIQAARLDDVMLGCASFDGTDPERLALPLSFLHHYAAAPEEWRARAHASRYVEMNRMPKEAVNQKAALRELPPP